MSTKLVSQLNHMSNPLAVRHFVHDTYVAYSVLRVQELIKNRSEDANSEVDELIKGFREKDERQASFLNFMMLCMSDGRWTGENTIWYYAAAAVLTYDDLRMLEETHATTVGAVCSAIVSHVANAEGGSRHTIEVYTALIWLISMLRRFHWKPREVPIRVMKEKIAAMQSKTLTEAKMEIQRLMKYGPAPPCSGKTHPDYPPRATVRQASWLFKDSAYAPVEFTHPVVLSNARDLPTGGKWADPAEWTAALEDEVSRRRSNALDRDELVHMENRRPRNPVCRTGMIGRGLLGKYGANQAADPLVTRVFGDKLQMVAIERADTHEWAIPGGMVDPEDPNTSATAKREFMEECRNLPTEDRREVQDALNDLFKNGGKMVFEGYVDDPRNTDWAWMETSVWHFHINEDSVLYNLRLGAGDDAKRAKWMDIDEHLTLYASHRDFVLAALSQSRLRIARETLERLTAHGR